MDDTVVAASPSSSDRRIKCLLCEKLGNANSTDFQVLHIAYLPPASALPSSWVRIRVTAAALNYADALQIEGKYQERPKLPFVPGNECSGVIVEVGRDVRALKVGDHVAAVTQTGAFSEEVIAPALGVVKIPDSCDIEAAAGLLVGFGTAWTSLKDRAQIKEGQTCLVLGAAGGVGLACVQLSRVLGARTIAVCRGKEKAEYLRLIGADIVINMQGRKIDELRYLVKKVAPEGVDVVFDPVGEPFTSQALRCIRWGGHLLLIGFAGSKIPKVPANVALVKNLTVHGIYWGALMQNNPSLFRKSVDEVARLFANGDISVNVHNTFSLEHAREAFSVLLTRKVIGKLLLLPGPRSML